MKKRKKKSPKKKPPRLDRSQAVDYDYHLPVFLEKTLDYLITDPNGIYIDGTLGGGGHTAEILKRLGPNGRLNSFDKDITAINHCNERFKAELENTTESKLTIFNLCFSTACETLDLRGEVQGVLLDLGVSSKQLDDPELGFSYRQNSRIDMRFGSGGNSAEDLLHAATEEELEFILRSYGEEPFSRHLARRIVDIRRVSPLRTTYDLRTVVEDSVPGRLVIKSLSRVFQALRIAVNDELNVLNKSVSDFIDHLKPGGRLVVMSYHSLEDKIVKTIFKEKSKKPKKSYQKTDLETTISMPVIKLLTAKPLAPDHDEILRNPRARSAKIRVCEKL